MRWHLPPNVSYSLTFFRGWSPPVRLHPYGLRTRLFASAHSAHYFFTSHFHHLLSRALARPVSSEFGNRKDGRCRFTDRSDSQKGVESQKNRRGVFPRGDHRAKKGGIKSRPLLFSYLKSLTQRLQPVGFPDRHRFLGRRLSSTGAPCRDRQSPSA